MENKIEKCTQDFKFSRQQMFSLWSPGLWQHVIWWVETITLEVQNASVFRTAAESEV